MKENQIDTENQPITQGSLSYEEMRDKVIYHQKENVKFDRKFRNLTLDAGALSLLGSSTIQLVKEPLLGNIIVENVAKFGLGYFGVALVAFSLGLINHVYRQDKKVLKNLYQLSDNEESSKQYVCKVYHNQTSFQE